MRTKMLAAAGMAAVGVQLILFGERHTVHPAGSRAGHRGGRRRVEDRDHQPRERRYQRPGLHPLLVRPGHGHLGPRGSRMDTSRNRDWSRRAGSGVGILPAVKLIAAQLRVSLDNAQLYAELTESRARIVAAADQTCRRIERDLHDGAQQRLANLVLQARMAQEAVPGTGELAARLDALAAEATTAMAATSPVASTRPCSPKGACIPPFEGWLAAPPSRSDWRYGLKGGCPSRSRPPPTSPSLRR